MTNFYQLLWRLAERITLKELTEDFINKKTGEYFNDWKTIVEKLYDNVDEFEYVDKKYVGSIHKRKDVLFDVFTNLLKRTVIFGDYSMRTPRGTIPGIHSDAGIGNLCEANTFSYNFNVKLREFYKEEPREKTDYEY
jgi:hypothetical protein